MVQIHFSCFQVILEEEIITVYPYVLVCMRRTPLGDLVLEQLAEDGSHWKKSSWKKTPLGVDLYLANL